MSKGQVEFEYQGRDLESMSFAQNYHRYIFKLLQPYLGEKIVEVGAGSGSFTSIMLTDEKLKKIISLEPSPEMFNLLVREINDSRAYKLKGFLYDHLSELKSECPQSFIYINVFEHIEDDLAEMKLVNSVLPKGGYLCIFVPALMALYSDFDKSIEHYRRYDKKDLERKLIEAGFEVTFVKYFDFLGVIPWWARFKLLKAKSLSPAAVKVYDVVGVFLIRVFEPWISLPFGKNLIAVAKKS